MAEAEATKTDTVERRVISRSIPPRIVANFVDNMNQSLAKEQATADAMLGGPID